MKKLLSLFGVVSFSFGGVFSVVGCNNALSVNTNNTTNKGLNKEDLNKFLNKKDLFIDINNCNESTSDIINAAKNDIDNAYDFFNASTYKLSDNNDISLSLKPSISKNSFQASGIKKYQLIITAKKTSKKVFGSITKSLSLGAINLQLKNIVSNQDVYQCRTTQNLKDLLYSKLSKYYNSETLSSISAQDLENDSNIQFILYQNDKQQIFSSNVLIQKLTNYKISITVLKNDTYFQATNNWVLGSFNLKYNLNDISSSLIQKIRNVSTNANFYNSVYKLIFNTYNQYVINNNLGKENLISSLSDLQNSMPNLVKIYSLKKLILNDNNLLNLNQKYCVTLQVTKENRFFSTLFDSKTINGIKFYGINIKQVPNVDTYFVPKKDLYNFKTGQDILNFIYSQLANFYNNYVNVILKAHPFTISANELVNDPNITIVIKDHLNKIINPKTNINDQFPYNVYFNVSENNFNYGNVHYFLPINNYELTSIALNNNVELNNISNQQIDFVANNSTNLDSFKQNLELYFVNLHNSDKNVHNFQLMTLNDFIKDKNISLSITQNNSLNDKNAFEFLYTYKIVLNINANDNYFKQITNKTWIYTNKKLNYNNDLAIINKDNESLFLNKPASKLINYAYSQLSNYYNKHVTSKIYDITSADLQNSNLKIKIFDSDHLKYLDSNQNINSDSNYKIIFYANNNSYFENNLNANIGAINAHVISLNQLTNTRYYHINAFQGDIFYDQLYQELTNFYNSTQDFNNKIKDSSTLAKDSNLKINASYILNSKTYKITNNQSVLIPKNVIVSIQISATNDKYFTNSSFSAQYSHHAISIYDLTSDFTHEWKIQNETINYKKNSTPNDSFSTIDNWILGLYNKRSTTFGRKLSLSELQNERKNNLIKYYFSLKTPTSQGISILPDDAKLNPKESYVILIVVKTLTANIFLGVNNFYQFIVTNKQKLNKGI